jgi:hypothetical protein
MRMFWSEGGDEYRGKQECERLETEREGHRDCEQHGTDRKTDKGIGDDFHRVQATICSLELAWFDD